MKVRFLALCFTVIGILLNREMFLLLRYIMVLHGFIGVVLQALPGHAFDHPLRLGY